MGHTLQIPENGRVGKTMDHSPRTRETERLGRIMVHTPPISLSLVRMGIMEMGMDMDLIGHLSITITDNHLKHQANNMVIQCMLLTSCHENMSPTCSNNG